MNWTAGILALCLIYIPMAIIFVYFVKRNREIDREYDEKIKEIYKRNGL